MLLGYELYKITKKQALANIKAGQLHQSAKNPLGMSVARFVGQQIGLGEKSIEHGVYLVENLKNTTVWNSLVNGTTTINKEWATLRYKTELKMTKGKSKKYEPRCPQCRNHNKITCSNCGCEY